jgi:type II secretory pathway pseudopilin PulG
VRTQERGYSLVALMAAVAVMLVLLAAAAPSWRYLVRNDKEEELLFRGGEIADAVARYQRRNGNALPVSLEVLVKGRFLRRAYKDPMTKDGKWRMIRPGEAIGPLGANPLDPLAASRGGAATTTTTTTTTRPGAPSQPTATMGGFQGVASTSTEKSLRIFNGRTHYNEWVFLPGQQRVIGRPVQAPGRPGAPLPGRPGLPGGITPGVGVPGGGVPGGGAGIPPNLAPPPPPA